MKKWKKFAALGLTGAMMLGLTACGGSSDSSPAPAQDSSAQEESGAQNEDVGGVKRRPL